MPPKRPQSSVFGEDDDVSARQTASRGGVQGGAAAAAAQLKRPRTTTSMMSRESNGANGTKSLPVRPPAADIQAQIAAAKARIEAMKKGQNVSQAMSSGASASPPPQPSLASSNTPALPPSAPKVGSSALPNLDAVRKQLEEAKRKAAERAALAAGRGQGTATVRPPSAASVPTKEGRQQELHPLLMQDGLRSPAVRSSPTLSGPSRGSPAVAERANPYLTVAPEDEAGPSRQSVKGRSMHRALQFNRAGRHIQAAEEARREAKLEELKRKIQESAKRAGMQEELTGEERRLKRPAPPTVEWWDASLLPQGDYSCVPPYPVSSEILSQAASQASNAEGKDPEGSSSLSLPIVLGPETPIDHYIQHPISIAAPSDKFRVEPKGVILTKKEMKKMRKQRRAAEREDKQDRIKMGLQAPDPPKVKLSNLMRVLTSEAVADPTKVEARVRREVAARKDQHERTNAERALTDEQRRDKVHDKFEKDEMKGVFVCVFKVKHLVSPSHKYKVRMNAKQLALTGLCVFGAAFALIVVEGAAKSIKKYKHLMLSRIDWTDPGEARRDTDGIEDEAEALQRANEGPQANDGEIKWSLNQCDLLFEGPERDRTWALPSSEAGLNQKGGAGGLGFLRARNAPTDYDAKEILGSKWSGFWDVARRKEEAEREAD